MFKQLVLVAFGTLVISSAMAADVTCAIVKKGRSVPVSKDALKLADFANVSTCDGDKFENIAKAKNATITKRAATAAELKAYVDAQSAGFEF